LDQAGVHGSLELSGSCDGQTWFPHFRVPVSKGGSPLQVVRETFADDPEMQVTQDSDGMVRMVEKGVPTDFLSVRINHISFDSQGFWCTTRTGFAICCVGGARSLGFRENASYQFATFQGGGRGNGPPAADAKHLLTGSINDITLAQALDNNANTFHGIWVYKDCADAPGKQRFVSVTFLRNPGFAVEE
jgi:hypothetical protein